MKRTVLTLGAVALVVVLAGCSSSAKPAAHVAASSPLAAPSSATNTHSLGIRSGQPPVTIAVAWLRLECVDESGRSLKPITMEIPSADVPSWTDAWALAPTSDCVATRNSAPRTALETAALTATHGAADADALDVLYGTCATVDTRDAYIAAGFVMAPGQIDETMAALKLCPDHPHAAKWRQAMARGAADAALVKSGREFGDGLHRVGAQIQAGTYVATNVEGCYWDRQDRDGGVIDTDFIAAAKRVQVTVRSTDYAFDSDSCGTWKPAK